ncbi:MULTISPECIES: hypothetical protein [Flavobacteriaceae]|uniref:hypothetical protein n=1 Tax=Flavobacteriaceae TaxID=49546 RepID=UPI001491E078|nr:MULTISPECIES: hypothetical protein [Allomuricauda]MDC6364645.1 hypothetical protein [Muricauda sp. AC10]
MARYYYLLSMLFICSIVKGQADELLNELNNWIENEKLSFIKIDFENSNYSNDSLIIGINIIHLNDALGDDIDLLPLYFKIYDKVQKNNQINKSKVRLQFNDYTGYCNTGTIMTNISMNDNTGIKYKQTYIPPSTEYACMLDFEAIIKRENKTQEEFASANKSSKLGTNQKLRKIDVNLSHIPSYLEQKFKNNGSMISFSNTSANYISAEISQIQSAVIYDKSFWEKIQIAIFLYELPDNYLKLLLLVDGQYAAGLASPSELGFTDMEPKYSNYLVKFGKKILKDTQDVLINQN